MTDIVEDLPVRPIEDILAAGTYDNEAERAMLKRYLWDNPTQRRARTIRNTFPELQVEVAEFCRTYDVTSDGSGYAVAGENIGAVEQAYGLNRGEAWVARFGGDWVGYATTEPESWAMNTAHCRHRHGAEEVPTT